jgi:hypothetical protein
MPQGSVSELVKQIITDNANRKLTSKATGQTCNTTEYRFKRLLHVMVRVVLEHLNHRHPALRFVVHLRFAAQGKDLVILVHTVGHVGDGFTINTGVGINCHEIPDLIQGQLQMIERIFDGLIKLIQFPAMVESVE